jgi:hypothetical protein
MPGIPRTGLLLFGALAGPAAWAMQFSISYGLTPVLCGGRAELILLVVTLVFAAVTVAALVVSVRSWRMSRSNVDAPPRVYHRARTLAYAGLLSSTFFLVVIIATTIPPFLVDPCRR